MSTLFPEAYSSRVQRLRVPSGFLLAALFLYFAHPRWETLFAGLPVSLAGLWLRSWAAGHLRKDQTLISSGPYAWTRNPLYLGTFLIALGCAVASARLIIVAAVCVLFIFIYLPVIELEQRHLAKLFANYSDYAARVPLLFPKPPSTHSGRAYSADLWRHNKEWKAWYGFLAVEAYLVVAILISSAS